MALTCTQVGYRKGSGNPIYRLTEAGSADTLLTSTMAARGFAFRLLSTIVKYSAAPTQAGAVTTLDSGAGAAYDAALNTGTANAQTTVYVPAGSPIFGSDDGLVVTAPAAGGVITATVTIYIEVY